MLSPCGETGIAFPGCKPGQKCIKTICSPSNRASLSAECRALDLELTWLQELPGLVKNRQSTASGAPLQILPWGLFLKPFPWEGVPQGSGSLKSELPSSRWAAFPANEPYLPKALTNVTMRMPVCFVTCLLCGTSLAVGVQYHGEQTFGNLKD